MSVEWYYRIMGEVVGPLSAAELRAHAQDGRITADMFIRKGSNGQWVSADRVKGLFVREPSKSQIPPMPPLVLKNSNDITASSGPAIQTERTMSAVYTMKGVQDLLEVYEDMATITPKGVLGFLNKGMKGTKEIPFTSIVAVQFKEAGALFNGYLQLSIPGGNESTGGIFAAVQDENTFVFRHAKNNAMAKEIKEYIGKAMRKARTPQAATPATSISDELQKLAQLWEQGVLSEDEFQAAKRKLIG